VSSAPPLPPFEPTGPPPDEAALLAYFEGRLSVEEAHRIEQWLATETPEADALEGLQMLPPVQVRQLSDRVNAAVKRAGKTDRRGRKRQPLSQGWSILFAVAVLIILVLVTLFVIAYLKRAGG
jgi:anti-sigma factor RsiW